jgi:hypothetical protein
VAKRNPSPNNTSPGPIESVGFGAPANCRKPAVIDLVGGEYALRQRSVHPDEAPTQSRQYETEPPLGPRRRPDPFSSPLKAELALWRAFLADEIDAILRDKD